MSQVYTILRWMFINILRGVLLTESHGSNDCSEPAQVTAYGDVDASKWWLERCNRLVVDDYDGLPL